MTLKAAEFLYSEQITCLGMNNIEHVYIIHTVSQFRRLPKNMGFWVVVFWLIRDNVLAFIGSQYYTWALS